MCIILNFTCKVDYHIITNARNYSQRLTNNSLLNYQRIELYIFFVLLTIVISSREGSGTVSRTINSI